ncbi:hypothetical protein [Rhodococcus ruber]
MKVLNTKLGKVAATGTIALAAVGVGAGAASAEASPMQHQQ